jgi:hypothetical protein
LISKETGPAAKREAVMRASHWAIVIPAIAVLGAAALMNSEAETGRATSGIFVEEIRAHLARAQESLDRADPITAADEILQADKFLRLKLERLSIALKLEQGVENSQ